MFLVGYFVTQLPHQRRVPSEPSRDDPSVSLDSAKPRPPGRRDHVAWPAHEFELHHRLQFEQRIDSHDRLVDSKFNAMHTLIDSQAERVVLALAAANKAVSKAELSTEKRFESVNDFRATLSDQTRTLVSKIEFDAVRDANTARIADLSSRLDKTDGKSAGLNAGWVYLLGILAAAGTVASIVLAIMSCTK